MHLFFRKLAVRAGLSIAIAAVAGCGELSKEEAPGHIPIECDYSCPSSGVLEGNTNISGQPNIDSFFGTAVDFARAAQGFVTDVNGTTAEIAVSLGIDPAAEGLGAKLSTAIEDRIAANVEGGLVMRVVSPPCTISTELAARAATDCDGGEPNALCAGICDNPADDSGRCAADAETTCTGVAPGLGCTGRCHGACTFAAGASCQGKCTGPCDAECSLNVSGVSCGGTCDGTCSDGGAHDEDFIGACPGVCTGRCTLAAGAAQCAGSCAGVCGGECVEDGGSDCSGSCVGECKYAASTALCGAGTRVSCRRAPVTAGGCRGSCEGEVIIERVTPVCAASASSAADLQVPCAPAMVEIVYKAAATGDPAADARAQARFRAWIAVFERHVATLATLHARGEFVLRAGTRLADGGVDALEADAEDTAVSASIRTSIGAACALGQLRDLRGLLDRGVADTRAALVALEDAEAAVGM